MNIVDHVRLATGLAHAVPGAVVTLSCTNGDPLIAAQHRLDAQLTLCQLRAALLAPPRAGVPRLADVVCGVSVDAGLHHIGGGVYRRRGEHGAERGADGRGADERWFATLLSYEHANAVFDRCAIDVPAESMNARFLPDPQLGVTAVRLACNDVAQSGRLDEIALWAVGACLVEELVLECRQAQHQSRDS